MPPRLEQILVPTFSIDRLALLRQMMWPLLEESPDSPGLSAFARGILLALFHRQGIKGQVCNLDFKLRAFAPGELQAVPVPRFLSGFYLYCLQHMSISPATDPCLGPSILRQLIDLTLHDVLMNFSSKLVGDAPLSQPTLMDQSIRDIMCKASNLNQQERAGKPCQILQLTEHPAIPPPNSPLLPDSAPPSRRQSDNGMQRQPQGPKSQYTDHQRQHDQQLHQQYAQFATQQQQQQQGCKGNQPQSKAGGSAPNPQAPNSKMPQANQAQEWQRDMVRWQQQQQVQQQQQLQQRLQFLQEQQLLQQIAMQAGGAGQAQKQHQQATNGPQNRASSQAYDAGATAGNQAAGHRAAMTAAHSRGATQAEAKQQPRQPSRKEPPVELELTADAILPPVAPPANSKAAPSAVQTSKSPTATLTLAPADLAPPGAAAAVGAPAASGPAAAKGGAVPTATLTLAPSDLAPRGAAAAIGAPPSAASGPATAKGGAAPAQALPSLPGGLHEKTAARRAEAAVPPQAASALEEAPPKPRPAAVAAGMLSVAGAPRSTQALELAGADQEPTQEPCKRDHKSLQENHAEPRAKAQELQTPVAAMVAALSHPGVKGSPRKLALDAVSKFRAKKRRIAEAHKQEDQGNPSGAAAAGGDTKSNGLGANQQDGKRKTGGGGGNWTGFEALGKRVKAYWPAEKKWFKGTVDSYVKSTNTHTILYDDGDLEKVQLPDDSVVFI